MLEECRRVQEERKRVSTCINRLLASCLRKLNPSFITSVHRPIYKGFPSLIAAEAWLRGDIPRGALVDPKLPDSLRWDGVVLSDSLMMKIKGRGQPHRPISKTSNWKSKQHSSRRLEAIDQELEAFHQTLRQIELARSRGYTTTPDGALVVYTDGSAMENGKRACKAGSGVWWGRAGMAVKS